jgi:hypothetical protein
VSKLRIRIKHSLWGLSKQQVLAEIEKQREQHEQRKQLAENGQPWSQLENTVTARLAVVKKTIFGLDKQAVFRFMHRMAMLQEQELRELAMRSQEFVERSRNEQGPNEQMQPLQHEKVTVTEPVLTGPALLNEELPSVEAPQLVMPALPIVEVPVPVKQELTSAREVEAPPESTGVVVAFRRKAETKAVAAGNTEAAAAVVAERVQAVVKVQPPKAVGLGYWDNIDAYLDTAVHEAGEEVVLRSISELAATAAAVEQPAQTYTAYQENVASPYFASVPGPEIVQPVQPNASALKSRSMDEKAGPLRKEAVTPIVEAPATEQSVSSPAITDEIRSLRQRYIVGKLTGEDLLDQRGRLIAAKHTPITSELMEHAEREGKLAELIVNMVIRGMEG